jgi:hypothetical protein
MNRSVLHEPDNRGDPGIRHALAAIIERAAEALKYDVGRIAGVQLNLCDALAIIHDAWQEAPRG